MKETYTIEKACENCGIKRYYDIPKGFNAEFELTDKICDNCECEVFCKTNEKRRTK